MSDSNEATRRRGAALTARAVNAGVDQQIRKSAAAWMLDDDTMHRLGRAARADGPIRSDDERLDWNHLPWHTARRYVVAIDAKASRSWEASEIGGAHLIVVVSRAASRDGLADIASKEISYIFAGDLEVDFASAMETLGGLFGIEKLLFAVSG